MVFAHYAQKLVAGSRQSLTSHQSASPIGLLDCSFGGSRPASFVAERPAPFVGSLSKSFAGDQSASSVDQSQQRTPTTSPSKQLTRKATLPASTKAGSKIPTPELSLGVDGWELDYTRGSRAEDQVNNSQYATVLDANRKDFDSETLRFVRGTVTSMLS